MKLTQRSRLLDRTMLPQQHLHTKGAPGKGDHAGHSRAQLHAVRESPGQLQTEQPMTPSIFGTVTLPPRKKRGSCTKWSFLVSQVQAVTTCSYLCYHTHYRETLGSLSFNTLLNP